MSFLCTPSHHPLLCIWKYTILFQLVTKVLLKGGALVVDYECQVGHSGVWESSPFITGMQCFFLSASTFAGWLLCTFCTFCAQCIWKFSTIVHSCIFWENLYANCLSFNIILGQINLCRGSQNWIQTKMLTRIKVSNRVKLVKGYPTLIYETNYTNL